MLKIENNIPIPPRRSMGFSGHGKYPFKVMQVNQSFFEKGPIKKLRPRISTILYQVRKRTPGTKYVTRSYTSPVEGMRVWRVA